MARPRLVSGLAEQGRWGESPAVATRAALILLAGSLGACARGGPTSPPPVLSPVPTSLPPDASFERAVARATRTRTGEPGPAYWQQWARYDLSARLDPRAARVEGLMQARYFNRSPDTLRELAVHLYQNLFRAGARANENVPVTGGLRLRRVAVESATVPEAGARGLTGFVVDGTRLWLALPRGLPPGDSIDVAFEWEFRIPPAAAPRMGQDGEVFFIAQWYPQIAVYDDVAGWQVDPYLGGAEFYQGYADYDVTLSVPDGWLVPATGELVNASDVLGDSALARRIRARRDSTVVRIVTRGERGTGTGKGTKRSESGQLEWRFQARGVRDFAWAASRLFVWDATHAIVGDSACIPASVPATPCRSGPDTVTINAFYRPEARSWGESARFTRHAVQLFSRRLWPYPYPHMSAVESTVYGMEYPMVTAISDVPSRAGLHEVTAHEVAHMWFPMQVGSDEKRHAWQDEGMASYLEAVAKRDFFPSSPDPELAAVSQYLGLAGGPGDQPLMTHGDGYSDQSSYVLASYVKPVAILRALRGVVGGDVFWRAFREYGRRWAGRHPQPRDLWNTFAGAAGRDLDWFWRQWFYGEGTLDQSLRVRQTGVDSLEVTIENRGANVMPVHLVISRTDGSVELRTIPVDVWLDGSRQYSLRLPNAGSVVRIEIDPDRAFPDTNRRNQRWTR